MSNANGTARQPRRRGIVVLATLALIAGLSLTAATGSATAKVNVVGNYSGTTSEGQSVTFRITNKGKVVNFVTVLNLGAGVPSFPDDHVPGGVWTDPCYGKGMSATVTASVPGYAVKKTAYYPLGKVFDNFTSEPGVPSQWNPPSTNDVTFKFKVTSGTNFAGGMSYGSPVPTSLGACLTAPHGKGDPLVFAVRKVG